MDFGGGGEVILFLWFAYQDGLWGRSTNTAVECTIQGSYSYLIYVSAPCRCAVHSLSGYSGKTFPS